MKYEYRKMEKELYCPKEIPQLITIGRQKFFCIKGKGNPNSEDFQKKVEVLYSLSYAIRMMPKKGYTPDGYFEYTVYPLEGFWDLSDEGRKSENLIKDELIYTIMIRQPGFVTKEVVEKAFEFAAKKKNPFLKDATFCEIEEGLSLQILHKGPFEEEKRSFDLMKDFIEENGYSLKSLIHKEIYLSDPRRVEKNSLKTILRYSLNEK